MSAANTANGGELRQRTTKSGSSNGAAEKSSAAKTSSAPDEPSVSFLDVLRALAGVALVSTIASYAVTHGESLSWNLYEKRPWWMEVAKVRQYMKKPLLLTNDQLASYDGSDPSKPILLALNRTIYDVSSSPAVYGPGGMYSSLAAKDASRSYITTCFDPVDDLVPYFGGVEEVYVPLWLSRKPPKEELDAINMGDMFGGKDTEDLIDDVHKKVGRKHIKPMQAKAYEKARERVREQVRTWESMFEKKGYAVVGKVIGVDEEDPSRWRHLGFCEAARKLRPGMGESLQEAMESVGKGDKMKLNIGKMMGTQGGKKKTKKEIKKEHMKNRDEKFKEKMGLEGESPKGDDEDAEYAEELANTRLEDMLKGGKYYGGDKKIQKEVEELLKEKPDPNDPEAIKRALSILRQRQKKKTDDAAKEGGEQDSKETKSDNAGTAQEAKAEEL